jgi:hypothetical protein
MARPIDIDALISGLDGSEIARERVALVLKTFSREQLFQTAAATLGVTPQRFHEIRTQILEAAIAAVEPKPVGRPAQPPPDPNLARIAELEQRIRDLIVERDVGYLREELIAAGMGKKLKRIQKKRR